MMHSKHTQLLCRHLFNYCADTRGVTKARTILPWSQEAIRAAWHLLGWNPRVRGGDAPRVVVCEMWWRSPFTNNKGYIFIVRRLGKQFKLILSRLDSISNLELNLRIHGQCGPYAHARADLQAFLTFCFKPILLSAHKLILLIYGDNTCNAIMYEQYVILYYMPTCRGPNGHVRAFLEI